MAGEVELIKAVEGNGTRRRNMIGNGLSIDRKRVAAYVRVSTDGEEQLQSFQSQKEYYQDKISKNKEWVMVGIYADEAITGTKTVKRDGFLKMINDCMAGMVDVILTKSISRFSRNLVDTLQYVRMLKDKGIAVIFEKENINTLSMESALYPICQTHRTNGIIYPESQEERLWHRRTVPNSRKKHVRGFSQVYLQHRWQGNWGSM